MKYPTKQSYAVLATTDRPGEIRIATQAEANAGTEANACITPLTLDLAVDALVEPASTTVAGIIELATDAEAIAKTATDRALTPVNLAALDSSATFAGMIEIATDAEAIAKTDTGRALVPANLAAIGSSATFAGLIEIATDAEAQAESSATLAIVPANLAAVRDATNIVYSQSPILQSNADTGVAPTGATADLNLMGMQEGDIMNQFILGAGQTIIAPRMDANGLLVSLDLTNNEGAEYNWGVGAIAKHRYIIGTSPAFRMDWEFRLADVTGADPVYVGFRIVAANNADYTAYTDFAFIGVEETQNTALVTIATDLNGVTATFTNTTDAWTDNQTHKLSVLVSAAGVVTYLIDDVAPTATAAFTFDAADVVIPCFHGLHGVTAPGAWNWVSCFVGLQ